MKLLARLLPLTIFLFWLVMLFSLTAAFASPIFMNAYRINDGHDPLSLLQMCGISLMFFLSAYIFYCAAKLKLVFVIFAVLILQGVMWLGGSGILWHVSAIVVCLPVVSVVVLFFKEYVGKVFPKSRL